MIFGGTVLRTVLNAFSVQSPTSCPTVSPASTENWKWMPPQTRLSPACCADSSKLVKSNVTQGKLGDVAANPVSAPKKLFRTSAAAWLKTAWPATYSGNAGVVSSGVHVGSWLIAELPVSFAFGSASIG